MAQHQYNNAVLSVTKTATPDPYIVAANGKFYLTFTAGDRVEIWTASSLSNFHDHAEKHVIWRPPPDTDYSNDIWAPELHSLHGRWYVYVAACNPKHGNKSHRMYVLGGPVSSSDPTEGGQWEFLGPIRGADMRQWAIDGTVIHLDGQIYFVYSGWPFDNPNESDLVQRLFIQKLADPVTAASAPVEICRPDEPWERSGDHGINEGPQYLSSPDNSWRGIVYSCAGSWTNEYKMNTLRFRGGDPLNPQSWEKSMTPLIQTSPHNGGGPWGPGHGSFVHVGDGSTGGETVAVYHATDNPTDGWENRKARMQRVVFTAEGPYMGGGVGTLGDLHAFSAGVGAGGGSAQQQQHHHHHHHEEEEEAGGSPKKKHGLKGFIQKLKDEL